MNRNEIAASILYACETGDPAVVNAEDYVPANVDYNDLADRFIASVNEAFELLPSVEESQIQYELYEIGKRHFGTEKDQLRNFFKCFYSIFFGYENGPRLGEFINIYGKDEFLDTLRQRCENPHPF